MVALVMFKSDIKEQIKEEQHKVEYSIVLFEADVSNLKRNK